MAYINLPSWHCQKSGSRKAGCPRQVDMRWTWKKIAWHLLIEMVWWYPCETQASPGTASANIPPAFAVHVAPFWAVVHLASGFFRFFSIHLPFQSQLRYEFGQAFCLAWPSFDSFLLVLVATIMRALTIIAIESAYADDPYSVDEESPRKFSAQRVGELVKQDVKLVSKKMEEANLKQKTDTNIRKQ